MAQMPNEIPNCVLSLRFRLNNFKQKIPVATAEGRKWSRRSLGWIKFGTDQLEPCGDETLPFYTRLPMLHSAKVNSLHNSTRTHFLAAIALYFPTYGRICAQNNGSNFINWA